MTTTPRTYSPAAEKTIRSDATVWMRGDIDASRDLYDRHTDWAHALTAEQRQQAASAAWQANNLLKHQAVNDVRRTLGELDKI